MKDTNYAEIQRCFEQGTYLIWTQEIWGSYKMELLALEDQIGMRLFLPNGHQIWVCFLTLPGSVNWPLANPWKKKDDATYVWEAIQLTGTYTFTLQIVDRENCGVLWDVNFVPFEHLGLESTRREVVVFRQGPHQLKAPEVFTQQKENRTGLCFIGFGKSQRGSLFYLQDLGALTELSNAMEISMMDSVAVEWPYLGFLTPKNNSRHLKARQPYTLQKGMLFYAPHKPRNAEEINLQYFSFLRKSYPFLTKPALEMDDLPALAQKSGTDLLQQVGCWKQVEDHAYLVAYFNDYENPPESMVQMAAAAPLFAYQNHDPKAKTQPVWERLIHNMDQFYDKELGVFLRWLPAESRLLDQSEEHKRSFIMDSWYVHYPVLKLLGLMEQGWRKPNLRPQIKKSIRYLQRLAQTFDYKWPVFFNIHTFEVLKTQGLPGDYGQKDIGGLYLLIMLKAYQLFGKKIYLKEADRATTALHRLGLDIQYQSHNTAYAAEALLFQYQMTGKKRHLRLAEICIGNLIRNCAVWDMKYGNASDRATFFSIFPLKEVAYSAVFEEFECAASFVRMLKKIHLERMPMESHVTFFMNEYVQYASGRLKYYYPPLLPEDILAEEPKTGFILSNAWIPLEDLGDGWEAAGQVGQEVYGVGALFRQVVDHVHFVTPEAYLAITIPFISKGKKVQTLTLLGEETQSALLWISNNLKQDFRLFIDKNELKGKQTIKLKGNSKLIIKSKNT